MTDQCLDAFLKDPYTKRTQSLLQWMGEYRAIQVNRENGRQTAVPMTLLKIDNPPKKPEDYWRDVIRNAGLYLAIWGNRIMFSQYAEDAMGFGLATEDTPQNQRMNVYKINPHWLSLCLDAPPDARYLHMRNPYVSDPPTYPGIAEDFVDYANCPTQNNAPNCPAATLACEGKKGFCYHPTSNKMVSTYFIDQYDKCPEKPGDTGNAPVLINNLRTWTRSSGFDRQNCPLSTCPTATNPPECPSSTIPCDPKGYCYDPASRKMVSTYFVDQYDKCPEIPSDTGNAPTTIQGTRVWVRSNTFDNNGKCKFQNCPATNPPECPESTLSCEQKGYCYDPAGNRMLSTYFVDEYDKCPEKPNDTGNDPITIDGKRMWLRQTGLDEQAKCQSLADRLGPKWTTASQKLNSTRTLELNELQQDATRLRTIQAERGEENRQEITELSEILNAKNRYLDLIHQENTDWDLLVHALIVFFFVAAIAVIPVVGYMSGRLSFRGLVISIAILIVIYVVYLVYQIRQTGIRDFTDPKLAQAKKTFGALDSYLTEQANIAQNALTEFVNENCLCPAEEAGSSSRQNTPPSSSNGMAVGSGKQFYTPGGLIFSDASAPHQMIDPTAQPLESDRYHFMIEWEDAWNQGSLNMTPSQVQEYMTMIGLPYDVNDDGFQRGTQETGKLINLANNIESGRTPFGIPLPVYIKMVLYFIYRDRRAIDARDIQNGINKFRDGTYTLDRNGACNYIKSIFTSTTFALTFGTTLQWFKYICAHPFIPLSANESLTRRL